MKIKKLKVFNKDNNLKYKGLNEFVFNVQLILQNIFKQREEVITNNNY